MLSRSDIYALLTINYIHWKPQPQEKLNGPTAEVVPARGDEGTAPGAITASTGHARAF